MLQSTPVTIAGLFEFKNVPAGAYWVTLRAGQGLRALRTATHAEGPLVASTNPSAAEVTVPGRDVVHLRFSASARALPSDVAPPSLLSLGALALVAMAAPAT